MKIDKTSVVHPKAKLASGVKLGPFCSVGENVQLDEGVELVSHVVIGGRTTIGEGTKIFPFACVGLEPQDLKFSGESSSLVVVKHNIISENVTMNPGTSGGGMLTSTGDNCLFMVGAHVAHDCRIGNNVILVNNVTLAGHIKISDWAIVGGCSAVHQFVRIGRHAMIGGMSGVENDVIPYGTVMGNRAHLSGLNLVGLKRRKFPNNAIKDLRKAYRLIFAQEGTQAERLDDVSELFGHIEPVMEIVDFIRADSNRAICQPLFEDAA